MLPKPFYEDELVTVYNDDSRKYIDEIAMQDLVVTDPPYGMAWSGAQRLKKFDVIFGDKEPFDTAMLRKLIDKSLNDAFVFCRWNNLPDFRDGGIEEPTSFISCVKNNWSLGNLEMAYAKQWEGCAHWAKPGHKWAKGRPADYIYYNRVAGDDLIHPTQKSVFLILQILEANQGENVFDPYGGSLTTAVAAKMLGRKCITFEIDKNFCELGVERLKQVSLFEKVKHIPMEQTSLI